MHDLHNNIDVKIAIAPPAAAQTGNTAMVSTILDVRDYNTVELAVLTGALVTTAATYAVTMDHGDNAALADAAPVPADMLVGTLAQAGFTGALVNGCRKIGYLGDKRYVRATITPTGNAAAAPVSALWVLGQPRLKPTANPPV